MKNESVTHTPLHCQYPQYCLVFVQLNIILRPGLKWRVKQMADKWRRLHTTSNWTINEQLNSFRDKDYSQDDRLWFIMRQFSIIIININGANVLHHNFFYN